MAPATQPLRWPPLACFPQPEVGGAAGVAPLRFWLRLHLPYSNKLKLFFQTLVYLVYKVLGLLPG